MGTFFIVAALVFIAVDVYVWLQTGQWDSITLLDLLNDLGVRADPSTDWYSVNQALRWLLNLPMWAWCLILGVIFRIRGAD